MRRAAIFIVAGWLLATAVSAQESAPPAEAVRSTPIFAITCRAGPAWKPGVPMAEQGLRDHYFYWKALDAAGRVVIAGPLGPDAGLILLYAADQAEAERVIAEDPASKAGVFVGEARPFIPRFVGKTSPPAVRP